MEPIEEIISGGKMMGYCRGLTALVGLPTEHVHRRRVHDRIDANSLVVDDVLMPKWFRYGCLLDKSHTKASLQKLGSQSVKHKPRIGKPWERRDRVAIAIGKRRPVACGTRLSASSKSPIIVTLLCHFWTEKLTKKQSGNEKLEQGKKGEEAQEHI